MVLLRNHVVVMPDGNRRWSKEHNLDHLVSYDICMMRMYENVIKAFETGFRYYTIWLGSTKKFYERPKDEVIKMLDVVNRCFVHRFPKQWNDKDHIFVNIVGEWEEVLNSRGIKHPLYQNPISPKLSRAILSVDGCVLTLLVSFDSPEPTRSFLRELVHPDTNISALPILDLEIPGLPKADLWLRTGDLSPDIRVITNDKSCYLATPTLWPDMMSGHFEQCVQAARIPPTSRS
ncbi:MAG: undecaprenyl diphosphate synthase family protein [Candidatus Pacebacteria bacterium]|nr:undecaprenyl diphosphate synthase family protein [Candidatus Paceibacterota bacterium]